MKCDVEGYEIHIIPHFLEVFAKYQPIIEIEVGPQENKELICKLLHEIGYQSYFMKDNRLHLFEVTNPKHKPEFELYFLSQKQQEELKAIIELV